MRPASWSRKLHQAAFRALSSTAAATQDGVLTLAGLRNAAVEAGVIGNRDISLEALPEMQADVVIVTEPNPGQPVLLRTLSALQGGADLPVIQQKHVIPIKSSLLTTLSQWNLVGAEQLNRAIYPGELAGS